MSKNSKGGPDDERKRAGALLDELDSVKSLLGDAAEDVPPPDLGEDDAVPTLEPEPADSDGQIPLLGGDADKPATTAAAGNAPKPASANESLRRALSERQNPFLAAAAKSASANAAPSSPGASAAPANPQASKAEATLSDQEINAMVNDVLASWMPRLEQELRQRLIAALRRQSNR